MDDETMARLKAQWQAMQEQIASCDLHVTVGGVVTPLRECDWVLRNPAGHVVTIMSAVQGDPIFATADDAWHEIYATQPHPHKRERDRAIKRMKADGYTVEIMRTEDAVKIHMAWVKGIDARTVDGSGMASLDGSGTTGDDDGTG